MNTKKIDGKVRKIKTTVDSKVFFDFEFWGESDEDTYGLVCLTQISEPARLFIIDMNSDELAISDDGKALQEIKSRVTEETGIKDLVFPKMIRFDRKKNDVTAGFKSFLSAYEKPIPVYESIFGGDVEAAQVEKLSIEQFKEIGGTITLLGNLSI